MLTRMAAPGMAHPPQAPRHGTQRAGRRGRGRGSAQVHRPRTLPPVRAEPPGGARTVPGRRGRCAAAAFFDLDNTVMQGAALFHFGRGLYKRKFFHKRDLARFAWQQA